MVAAVLVGFVFVVVAVVAAVVDVVLGGGVHGGSGSVLGGWQCSWSWCLK